MKRDHDPYQGSSERGMSGTNPEQLGKSLLDNLIVLRRYFADSDDLHINRMRIGEVEIAMIDIEGMTDEKAGELIMAARNICWFGDEA